MIDFFDSVMFKVHGRFDCVEKQFFLIVLLKSNKATTRYKSSRGTFIPHAHSLHSWRLCWGVRREREICKIPRGEWVGRIFGLNVKFPYPCMPLLQGYGRHVQTLGNSIEWAKGV